MRSHKYGNDPITDLKGQVADVRKRVKALQNKRVTTSPVQSDSSYFTGDAIEGQLALDTTAASPVGKFYQNGQWWPMKSRLSAVQVGNFSVYNIAPVVNQSFPTFSHNTPFDFSVTTNNDPDGLFDVYSDHLECQVEGLYSITAVATMDESHHDVTKYYIIQMWTDDGSGDVQWESQRQMSGVMDSSGSVLNLEIDRTITLYMYVGYTIRILYSHNYPSTTTGWTRLSVQKIDVV